jgi:hypothetical protein
MHNPQKEGGVLKSKREKEPMIKKRKFGEKNI